MGVSDKIKRSLAEKWSMRFRTHHPDDNRYHGIVVHGSDELVILMEEADFELDGYQIFPKSSIRSIRDNKYEICGNNIVRHNGQIDRVKPIEGLKDCADLYGVFKYMYNNDIWPGVETVYQDKKGKPISAFYIGPIVKMQKDSFLIKCYDAAGKWEDEYKIEFAEVFRVEIDTKYCRHFNAFMRANF